MEESIKRAKAYSDAGADLIFLNPSNKEEIKTLKDSIDTPLVFKMFLMEG